MLKVEWVGPGFDLNPEVYFFQMHEKEVMQCNKRTSNIVITKTGKIFD